MITNQELKELKDKELKKYDPTSLRTACKNIAKRSNGITTKNSKIVLYKAIDYNFEKKMTVAFLHELIHVLTNYNGLPDGFDYPYTNILEPTVQLITKLYALKNPHLISTEDIDKYYKESTEKLDTIIQLIGEKYLFKLLFRKYEIVGCSFSSSECILANAILKRIPKKAKECFGKSIKNLPTPDLLAKKIRDNGITIVFTTNDHTEVSNFFKKYEQYLTNQKQLSEEKEIIKKTR